MRLGMILAAGQSLRFGAEDKLLAPWHGRPLITWAAEALRQSGCDSLGAVISSPEVGAVLPDDFARHLLPPGLPMSASFALALRNARDAGADGLLICLGDMPNISAALLRRLLASGESCACLQGDRRMPPAHIAAGDFGHALGPVEGDRGAREFLATLPRDRLIRIDARAAHDIDWPGDLSGPA